MTDVSTPTTATGAAGGRAPGALGAVTGLLRTATAPLRRAAAEAAIVAFATPLFAPSPNDPLVGRPDSALRLLDLKERVISYDSNNPDYEGATPTIDDAAAVAYELTDPSGTVVGRTKGVGRMLYKLDDGFVAWFSEVITLTDGTVVRTGGLVDDARLTAGEAAIVPAVAISGPYRGATGFHRFRPVVPHEEYDSAIVLHRRV